MASTGPLGSRAHPNPQQGLLLQVTEPFHFHQTWRLRWDSLYVPSATQSDRYSPNYGELNLPQFPHLYQTTALYSTPHLHAPATYTRALPLRTHIQSSQASLLPGHSHPSSLRQDPDFRPFLPSPRPPLTASGNLHFQCPFPSESQEKKGSTVRLIPGQHWGGQ